MAFTETVKIPLWDGTETDDVLSGQRIFENIAEEISLQGLPDSFDKFAFNPVLDLGAGGTWDDVHVLTPSVIKDGSTYKMWYSGYDGTSWRIGYATSTDGKTWTKDGSNPVLDLGAGGTWDDVHVLAPSIIKDGATYKMWYSGYDGTSYRIGYATSTDGKTWTKDGSNPVLDLGAGGTWDDDFVRNPSVIKDGATYKMWYNGYDGANWRIGYATSTDGKTWTKDGSNPVLDLGAGGEWDDARVYYSSVIKDGSTYKMWYTGYDGTSWRIGYATSTDGKTWTKDGSNPVLDLGAGGTWDDVHVLTPSIIKDGATYKMWYAGEDGTNNRIGYAISDTFPATSPSPDIIDWMPLPVDSVIDMSTIRVPELMNDGDDGSVEYQYASNNGAYNGSWLSQTNLRLESDITITDATNSFKIKPRYNSDGTQKATSQAFALVDVSFPDGGVSRARIVNAGGI